MVETHDAVIAAAVMNAPADYQSDVAVAELQGPQEGRDGRCEEVAEEYWCGC